MKNLKKEIRSYIAEKLIYWAICIDEAKVDLFIKEENIKMEKLVKEAKEYLKTKKS